MNKNPQESTMQTDGTAVRAEDPDYDAFLAHLQTRFYVQAGPDTVLFTTDAVGLFDAYLDSFPAEERQHYNCRACKRFLETYGHLVTIDPVTGTTEALLWSADAPHRQEAVTALRRLVTKARVTGVALFDVPIWGQPITGAWRHMAITPHPVSVFKPTALKTASQAIAEKREDYGMIMRSLADFPAAAVDQAVTMLEAETLYRSEKVLGVATWLQALHRQHASVLRGRSSHIVWRAAATAPVGFAHVRSSMIGTLLEDIVAGLPFEEIKRRFAAKMNPTKYQRPQAPPSAGAIVQAEKVIAELKSAGALDRRFARLDEIVAVWRPAPPPETHAAKQAGVFSHLQAKNAALKVDAARTDIPPITMTWDKFSRVVLPTAAQMQFLIPNVSGFAAFLTAANPEAPPIFQWDRAEKRNPFSMYTYSNGSPAVQWGLVAGAWVLINAITLRPSQWDGENPMDHQGKAVFFLLDGALDTRENAGNALFPETMRSEYHGIRSVIEAYSRTATIGGRDEANACGIFYSAGGKAWPDCLVRVKDRDGALLTYKLDRWD